MSDSNDVSGDSTVPDFELDQEHKRSSGKMLDYLKYALIALLLMCFGMIVGVGIGGDVGKKDARRTISPHYVEHSAPDAKQIAEAIGAKELVFSELEDTDEESPLTVNVAECGVSVSSTETYGHLSMVFNTPADNNGRYQDKVVLTMFAMQDAGDAEKFVSGLGASLAECEVPKVFSGKTVGVTQRLDTVRVTNPVVVGTRVDERDSTYATAYAVGHANDVLYAVHLLSFGQDNAVDRALNVAGVITSNLYRERG